MAIRAHHIAAAGAEHQWLEVIVFFAIFFEIFFEAQVGRVIFRRHHELRELLQHLIDAQISGVQHHGIFRGLQWRHSAGGIGFITALHIGEHLSQIQLSTLGGILIEATLRADFRGSCHEDLHGCIGQHYRANIPAFDNTATSIKSHRALDGNQVLANLGNCGDCGNVAGDFRTADFGGDIFAIQQNFGRRRVFIDLHGQFRGGVDNPGNGCLILRIEGLHVNALTKNVQGGDAIHRTSVQVFCTSCLGDQTADRGLSGAGGSIDGED